MKAWNKSGAKVKFVETSRSRARLVIRYFPTRECVGFAYAQPLYDASRRVARAEVVIPRPRATNAFCSRWGQALVVAHELGHVLGLGHEGRRCATMNPATTGLAPAGCPSQPEWRWHCRLLEADDVRGAVRLYGGRVKPRPERVCDLLQPPAPLSGLVATPSPAGFQQVDVSFVRPAQPQRLPFMRRRQERYSATITPGACRHRLPLQRRVDRGRRRDADDDGLRPRPRKSLRLGLGGGRRRPPERARHRPGPGPVARPPSSVATSRAKLSSTSSGSPKPSAASSAAKPCSAARTTRVAWIASSSCRP